MSKARDEKKAALVKAFREASQAAQAVVGTEDGGTCNFDTPILTLAGWRESLVQECAAEAGIEVDSTHWLGAKRFFVRVPLAGQANRRSRMAEAAARSLKGAGYQCQVYYQMD